LPFEVVGAERWRIYEMPEPFAHDRRTWIDNRRISFPCGISIAAVDTSCVQPLERSEEKLSSYGHAPGFGERVPRKNAVANDLEVDREE
jgi:hypothetical protein